MVIFSGFCIFTHCDNKLNFFSRFVSVSRESLHHSPVLALEKADILHYGIIGPGVPSETMEQHRLFDILPNPRFQHYKMTSMGADTFDGILKRAVLIQLVCN